MNTYLMTWNPQNWTWTKLHAQAEQTANGNSVNEPWSCGNTKRINPGERLFLLKQGPELPKGIMAAGFSSSGVYEDKHWDDARASKGEMALYVDAEWDVILDPDTEPLLPVSAFTNEELPPVHWHTQKSGITIPSQVSDLMEKLWKRHVDAVRAPDHSATAISSDSEEDEFPEGKVLYRLHRTHERNPQLVKQAKARAMRQHGSLACTVCDFDFFKTYGPVGENFIECHHTVPVSELEDGAVTKIIDVVLVCSNCHRMLHRRRPWLGHDELRSLIAGQKAKK